MQKLKQEKARHPEAQEKVWCIKYRSQGYDKDHWVVFANYVATRELTPLRPKAQEGPSRTPFLWCAICQVGGKHKTDNSYLLPKFH